MIIRRHDALKLPVLKGLQYFFRREKPSNSQDTHQASHAENYKCRIRGQCLTPPFCIAMDLYERRRVRRRCCCKEASRCHTATVHLCTFITFAVVCDSNLRTEEQTSLCTLVG